MKFLLTIIGFVCCSLFNRAQIPNNESSFKSYFSEKKDSLDPIEGIWLVSSTQEFYRYDTLYNVDKYPRAAKVAIVHNGKFYDSYNLTGESYDVSFYLTDVKGVYLYKNYFRSTNEYSNTQAVISTAGVMQYTYEFPDEYLRKQFGDSYEVGTRVVNLLTWKKTFPEDANVQGK
ncbi:MAG TPA: hypothetical protein PKM97_09190 [Bacteroidia bacterium]|nr:hypothetical protein [Bacteroidia bacterium]